MLRLRDRNMQAVERAASQAAGLDSSRAGAYLTAEQVAELSGRSEAELQALAAHVQQLGGQMELIGPLRDMAAACFPAAALHALTASGSGGGSGSASSRSSASLSAPQRQLLASTRRAIRHRAAEEPGGGSSAAAAEALAASLPPQLARFTAFIQPLAGLKARQAASAATEGSARQRRLLQEHAQPTAPPAARRRSGPYTIPRGAPLRPLQPAASPDGSAAASGVEAAALQQEWEPIDGEFFLTVKGGDGGKFQLPSLGGNWNGYTDMSTGTAWGVPQFPYSSLLYFLGVTTLPNIVNNINTQLLASAAMLPCKLTLGKDGRITGVT